LNEITRHALVQRAYVATAHGVEAFGLLVTAVVEARNGFAAPVQEVFGDGASWIWRLGGEMLPGASWILDRWHWREARRRALRTALPDKTERAPWSARVEDCLEVGDVPIAPPGNVSEAGGREGGRCGGQPAAQRAARHALVAQACGRHGGAARRAPQRRLGPPRPPRPHRFAVTDFSMHLCDAVN
jgi:hypothetical protein